MPILGDGVLNADHLSYFEFVRASLALFQGHLLSLVAANLDEIVHLYVPLEGVWEITSDARRKKRSALVPEWSWEAWLFTLKTSSLRIFTSTLPNLRRTSLRLFTARSAGELDWGL